MSTQIVLITGATGHIGFRTLVFALQAGYRVRVALRKLEQADKIKTTASIQPFLDSIEFVQVPDITAADAYSEAIKGVDLVLHVASPIPSGSSPGEVRSGTYEYVLVRSHSNLAPQNDWQKVFYDPAVKGTTSMLSAAAKERSVKRVVITSSVAVLEPRDGSDRAGRECNEAPFAMKR